MSVSVLVFVLVFVSVLVSLFVLVLVTAVSSVCVRGSSDLSAFV